LRIVTEPKSERGAYLALRSLGGSGMKNKIIERQARRAALGARRVELVMGVPIGIDIRTALPERALRSMLDDAFAWLRWVDHTFSTYRPDSQINRLSCGEKIGLAPEVIEVLGRCAELRGSTEGFFDAHAGGALDPSGYVKGWAVEKVSRRLTAAGAVDHSVNAGADVRVRGSARPGVAWRVGIRHPRRDGIHTVAFAHDLAVATSGSRTRGAQVIDPHARRPVTDVGSVTVVGPDLGVAGAYATALYAMGPLRARAFHLPTAYESLIISGEGRSVSTPGFSHYTAGRLAV
jgi:thiamine biosynthesis lipoprotein